MKLGSAANNRSAGVSLTARRYPYEWSGLRCSMRSLLVSHQTRPIKYKGDRPAASKDNAIRGKKRRLSDRLPNVSMVNTAGQVNTKFKAPWHQPCQREVYILGGLTEAQRGVQRLLDGRPAFNEDGRAIECDGFLSATLLKGRRDLLLMPHRFCPTCRVDAASVARLIRGIVNSSLNRLQIDLSPMTFFSASHWTAA